MPTYWKLQVYNAVIIAQLIYGMNTMHMTESALKRLDAFHFKGLRHILNIEHAYFSIISNEQILEKVNIAANKVENLNVTWEQFKGTDKSAKIKIKPISELIKKEARNTNGTYYPCRQ